MPKLRRVSGQEAIRALERLGFVQIRQRGRGLRERYQRMVKADKRMTSVLR